jgi:epoxyqueuosine reductase QueG
LGILIHPEYGLWHAYRAALLFAESIELPPRADARSPCDTCAGKPCLSACPVHAFTNTGFDDRACTGHITQAAGRPCMDGGCLARNACPVAPALRYGAPQLQFHMAAFRRARQS